MERPRALYPDLRGRTAVVTGAARGIGAAHVRALIENGVNVVAADIAEAAMRSTARQIEDQRLGDGRVVPARIDVSAVEDHQRTADLAVERFGRLDIWINNAGVFPRTPIADVGPDELHRTFDINVNGILYGSQAAAARFTDGGAIVNMASIAGLVVRAGDATYGVSKAAADHLTRFLAVELGPAGTRVNAIAPGIVQTEMTRWVDADVETRERIIGTIPLRRLGVADVIADAMLFLASDASRFVTGHTLVVDGGGRYR